MVAAVNVLNAAFMAGSAVLVALLQTAGMTTPQLFLLLGAASLLVAAAIGRTMPASALSDALSILYRTLFREGRNLRAAAVEARTTFSSAPARVMLDFIAASTRGVCADVGSADEADGN